MNVNFKMITFNEKLFRPLEDIESYHVHLYYNGRTKQYAGHLRKEIKRRFNNLVEIGRWRDMAPQGPHPNSHFQIAFPVSMFNQIVPFLALNRGGLHILLHPNTGNGYDDHTKNVMWIGPSIPLNQHWLDERKTFK